MKNPCPRLRRRLRERRNLPLPLRARSEAVAEPVFAIPPASEVYLSEPAEKTLWGGQLFLWLVFGLLGAMLMGSAYLYGVHVGQSEISSAARPAADSEPPIEPRALAPVPVPTSPVATHAPPTATVAPSAPTAATSIPNVAASAPRGAFVNASKTDDAITSTRKRPGSEGQGAALSDKQRTEQAQRPANRNWRPLWPT